AIVLGSGRIAGRPVIVAAEDFTVLAGTISHTSNSKRYRAAELAGSGRVPLVTAVLGSSAGHGALVAPISDFAVMSAHGAIFTAGPPVVKESLGETVTKEELGGPTVAVASGLIHNAAADDGAALDLVRRYLGYFPSSAWSYPPDVTGADTGSRLVPEIVDIVPR